MSKAVLISIRPKWCELIASGEKTIEVRKTKPSAILPLKCYIYCTKPSFPHEDFLVFDAGTNKAKAFYGGGKVIGEFVCHDIFPVWPGYIGGDCLTFEEQEKYLGANGRGYGWFISDLVIYDEPKELGEFQSWNTGVVFEGGYPMPTHEIKRPPQSWMYVEELT